MEEISLPNLKSTITYHNVLDGVDIQYDLYGPDIKESIIINEPQDSYLFTFSIYLDNLVPVLDEMSMTINLMDGEEIAYVMPAPFMFDADGEYSDHVAYGLHEVGNGQYIIAVAADSDWINDTGRAFPVTIDPTLENATYGLNGTISTTHILSGDPNTVCYGRPLLFCGLSSCSESQKSYIYLNVNTLPKIPPNCVITDSQISLYYSEFSTTGPSSLYICAYNIAASKPSAYSTYKSWIEHLTYNNSPSSDGIIQDYRVLTASNQSKRISWDIVRLAQEWYANEDTDSNHMIMLGPRNPASYVEARFIAGSSTPVYFLVSYINTVGLEDYHTYQTHSAGRAGTVYIGDFTQDTPLVHPDVTLNLSPLSFTVSHVYNSANFNIQYSENESNGLHTNTFTNMKVGAGWKLSVQETIEWKKLGSTWYAIYNDADGTEHYLLYDSKTRISEDEDGLGLTMTYEDSGDNYIYTLTDKDAYTTKVFNHGYLTSITDSNGNALYFVYGNHEYSTSDSS